MYNIFKTGIYKPHSLLFRGNDGLIEW